MVASVPKIFIEMTVFWNCVAIDNRVFNCNEYFHPAWLELI